MYGYHSILIAFELEEGDLGQNNPWGACLQACAYGIMSTCHTTLHVSPGKFVFGRDVIHDIRFQANWDRIKHNKQNIIEKSHKRENLNTLKHTYKVGYRILMRVIV
jgi:hypothetical protein